MKQNEVMKIIDMLAGAYAFKDCDDKFVHAWTVAFQDVPRMWLARHAMKWIETEKWMPKISELRYRIDQEMRGLAKDSYYRPPENECDEYCAWVCFVRGITPDELTITELAKIYSRDPEYGRNVEAAHLAQPLMGWEVRAKEISEKAA